MFGQEIDFNTLKGLLNAVYAASPLQGDTWCGNCYRTRDRLDYRCTGGETTRKWMCCTLL